MDKETAREEIAKLVQIFKNNINQYKLPTYKEAQVRKEFIDKFFKALDWDIDNQQGFSEQFKEVVNEDAIKIGGNTKAPDYSFRIGGQRIFFVEAKKPSVNLKENSEFAYQLRRYAWNTGIPISILTNFEEFAVYDCRVKPNERDDSSVARIMLISYTDYLNNLDNIEDIFSKEAVLKGSFDRFVGSKKGMKGTAEVDSSFLKEIEKWRDDLAKNIALRNTALSLSELNYAVQKIIDRILFLIICECKNIEKEGKLKEIAGKSSIYKNLMPYFKESDDKYNSSIFDFAKDKLTPNLRIDDKILKEIIDSLYYPKSPYDFSVLPIEILGKVYEKFLGKTIRLTSSHQAKVEEKPEVRKAGGVYYTPKFIVDYIVKNTVGKLIDGKTLKKIENIKILDSACGSGTFLVRAYSYILDYLLEYYKKNPKKFKKEIYQTQKGSWFLTTEVRKRVLLNNIYGVDIDAQAVEVTKLSLLLKVLENETKESVNQQLKLFKERALPNLDNNIKCGNSVVNSTYFSQQKLSPLSTEKLTKINPFDWDKEFPFKFDVVIGNPPYVKEYTNREIFEEVKKTDMAEYYQGKMDFWYFFTCKALNLLKKRGLHSYIAQNNWVTNMGASILRNKILSDSKILSFFDFNDFRVFKDADIQTMVFVLEKEKTNRAYSIDYYKVIDKNISKEELTNYLMTKKDGEKIQRFKAKINPSENKNKLIVFVNTEMGDIFENMKKANVFYLTEKEITNGLQVQQEYVNKSHLKVLGEGFKIGEGIFVISNEEKKKLDLSEKEKELIKPLFTPDEINRYKISKKNHYWVIYTSSKFKNPSEIKPYPHIKEHLDKFRKVITTDFKPYGIHRTREENFFKGEKIISIRKCSIPCFSFVDFDSYVNQVYYVIKTTRINMKFLTGLLNSKLIYFWLYHNGKKQGEQLQIDRDPLVEIPIIKSENKEIIEIVDLIINLNKKLESIKLDKEKEMINKQISALEKKIGTIVYKLYGLKNKEIEIVEKS